MTTETKTFDSELENMQDMSESELDAALGSLGLQGEPINKDKVEENPTAEEPVAEQVEEPSAVANPDPVEQAEEKTEASPAATATEPAVEVESTTDGDETAEPETAPESITVPAGDKTADNTTTEAASAEATPAEAATAPAPSASTPAEGSAAGDANSRVDADIAEKLNQTIQMAKEASEAGEFVSARKLLDEIPESRRTEEVNDLLFQYRGMMEYEQLWLKAKKYVQTEEYVSAVESLEAIPENLRTQQMSNMLQVAQNQATVTIAIRNAQQTLREYHFKGAIEILEGVPKERRSDALIELLRETYRITRRLDDLRLEGDKRFQKALMGITMEHLDREEDDSFDNVLDIYQEILELCPIDEEARDRAEKAANYIELSKQREELQEYARLHMEEKHFRDALECLQKVHPDVQTGPIREQILELEGLLEEIDELRAQILENFENAEFENTAKSFERLKGLHEGEFNRLLRDILGEDLEISLGKVFKTLQESESEDPTIVGLLDYLMDAIQQEDFENLLTDPDQRLFDRYPVSGKGMYLKLIKILSTLTEDADRFQVRLDLLKRYREHLKEAEPNLTAWEELLEALEQFAQLQSMPWQLKDRWIENDRTNLIETVAYRVADAANSALPQGEGRWKRLLNVAGPQLTFKHTVSRVLYKQIQKYLEVGSWSGKKVCIITRRVALLIGLGGIGSVVLLELMKIYYDIFFKAGGFSAVLASFLLFLIWGTFCILAHRWIDE